jgi:hypothetical protein
MAHATVMRFDHGLKRLAFDVADAMENCAAAFEAERQRRIAEEGNAAAGV